MSNFGGHYDITIHDGTRVFIPAKLRDEFNGKAVVCRPLNKMRCIFIYTKESWNDFVKRSEQLYTGEALVYFKTYINSTMNELPVDKQGRLNIGQEFAEYADLTHDITLVGAGTHLQLWDKDILAQSLASESTSFDPSLLSY